MSFQGQILFMKKLFQLAQKKILYFNMVVDSILLPC